MKINFRAFHIIIILITGLSCAGLQPVFSQDLQLRFKHLTTEDGLSQSTVRAIFQDKMGFMWFGTDIGINKYDGSKITVYKYNAEDTAGIPSNFIVEIFEDSYGVFWVGTGSGGLARFDREQEVFYKYQFRPGDQSSISNNNIRAIFEDSQKNLWIGTAGGGLNVYNRKTDSFISFQHSPESANDIGSNYISGIAEDRKGFLWLASPEGVVTKYNPKTRVGYMFNLYADNVTDRGTTTFGQVNIDSDENVWVASETGLFCYDQQTSAFQHFVKGNTNKFLNENAVSDVHELEKGIFLIATDHGGINVYNKHTGTFTYHRHSKYDRTTISNDQLYTIYQSVDGIVWIGNFHGGINILDPKAKKFMVYSDLIDGSESSGSNSSVLTIGQDPDGNIWFGYDGEGIGIYNSKTRKISDLKVNENNPQSILSNSVTEIYKDRQGDMWIGTYLRGLSKLDWKTKKFTHFQYDAKKPDGIGGNNIWAILEDTDGYLWLGLQGNGVDRFDRKTGRFTHYKYDPNDLTSLSSNDTYKVFEDSKKNIWISTRYGLCLFNKMAGNFTRYISGEDLQTGIFGNSIYDIFEDAAGNLWVGTDQALNLFNPVNKTFEHFQERDGLSGNAILSIIGDNQNNLWISTNKGLSRFDLAGRKFRNYDIADGLPSNEFNYVSVLSSSEGKIYFGGKSGFTAFYPDSVTDNPIIPPVYFTGLKVLNEPVGPRQNSKILHKHITFEKNVIINHKQSVITFEFAALNYSNPEKNQHAYWLQGFDKGWNYIGNRHEITYTNLNPGQYVLKVKGSNNDGIWNEEEVSLRITILPPWWKTWWFRFILYGTLAGLVIAFYYLRLAFYQNQQKKLMLLVKERTLQLEEVAVSLEEKQEEINSQNEELLSQKEELENNNSVLFEQKRQILEQNEELDKHRNQLEKLVEERTRELIEAKNKAEESDRLKSSFLANLSHEIRTPLNAILGFSSLLGEKDITDLEREEYNRIIQNSSNTLLDLISDILDISKIEAGQLELDLREVSLEGVLSDLVGIFEMFMTRNDIGSNKSVQLKVSITDELRQTHIITDNLRLTQILSNLINNAIKFTEQGYIEVGCTKVPHTEMLEFYVKDTGVGIKEENQQMVFERFSKVEENKKQLHRGTGLGLAISNQLVNLLGGTMRLKSKVGEGSVFYFTIPLIRVDSTYKKVQLNKTTDVIPDFKDNCILVAEDDMANFNYIDKLLRKTKAKVIHAENGKQVLKLAENTSGIQLILMDIKMPEMDGIETLHELKKRDIKIPVIAQTAYALADEIVKLKREGFNEYISKPIQQENLYALLLKYLG